LGLEEVALDLLAVEELDPLEWVEQLAALLLLEVTWLGIPLCS
jgi:hypothetical protein